MCLEEEGVLEVVLPGRQMTYLGEGRVFLGGQGVGGNYTD